MTSGELRRSQNWIGPGGAGLHEAAFVPPPPHAVPEALSGLERFLHEKDNLPVLIKVGLAHAQFETIHPFLDGNGRVGRLLITFLLTERQLLSRPVLYLSHYFKCHRQTYYEKLQAVRDTGDWEGWLTFFLRGVVEVAGEAADPMRFEGIASKPPVRPTAAWINPPKPETAPHNPRFFDTQFRQSGVSK